MSLESVTITFTGTSEKLKALDAVAESKQRSRDNLLREALDMYLALCEHHRTLIEVGIGDADAGRVVSHQSLKDMSKLWGPR